MEEDKKTYEIENNKIIKTINIYNTKKAPETRCYFSANYVKKFKSIVCIGGTNKKCDLVEVVKGYNTEKTTWKTYDESESFDKPITGHTSTVVSDKKIEKLFVFGGFDESNNYTTHAYLLSTGEMTQSQIDFRKNKRGVAEYPPPRAYHTANYDVKTNCVYIYGGTDMNISNSKKESFQSVWEFSLDNLCWEKIVLSNPNKNGAPRGHISIKKDRKLYIFGGVILFKKFTNALFSIDLDRKVVENIEYNGASPQPVAFHSGDIINERCFIVQGGLDQNYNPINDCYVYYFSTKMFVKIEIPLIPALFGHKLISNNEGSVFIVGGMDSFKYVGDENLIYKPEKEGDDIFNKIEEEIKFNPMEQMFEMVLKIEDL